MENSPISAGTTEREPRTVANTAEERELEAVIEEARKRARRRRRRAAALAIVAGLVGAGIVGFVTAGGDGPGAEPTVAPDEAVSRAARATIESRTSEITVSSTGRRGERYSFSGLIDLPSGEFDLRLDPDSEARPDSPLPRSPMRLVAASRGEGENPVYDLVNRRWPMADSLNIKRRDRCWFSNPFPVQINGGMSIEEGGALAGAILESLPREIANVEALGDGLYAVELKDSASQPRDITKPGVKRTWGSRGLLANLDGPIKVGLGGGRVDSLALKVDDYRPRYSPGLYRPEPADSIRRDGVSLDVTLGITGRELTVRNPGCLIVT